MAKDRYVIVLVNQDGSHEVHPDPCKHCKSSKKLIWIVTNDKTQASTTIEIKEQMQGDSKGAGAPIKFDQNVNSVTVAPGEIGMINGKVKNNHKDGWKYDIVVDGTNHDPRLEVDDNEPPGDGAEAR